MGDITVTVAINFIKIGVLLYDIITYPIYAIIQRPWQKRRAMRRDRVSAINNDLYCYIIYFNVKYCND